MENKPFTVDNLPSAKLMGKGLATYVDDALAPIFLAEVVGGGNIQTLVFSDGITWKVGEEH